ncbi:MAG: hypothetical protein AAFZ15_03965 [Bacteroidota bacterium]
MKLGFRTKEQPDVREIWVLRDDGTIEVKKWFIFTLEFIGDSKEKIQSFVNLEKERYAWGATPDKKKIKRASKYYSSLGTKTKILPPRLIWFKQKELELLDTELCQNGNGFVYGDSVGGIAPNLGKYHNAYLKDRIHKSKKILFNPGVLARIIINVSGQDHYVFQLAEKNLRKKGHIFYKPIGGHIKFSIDNIGALVSKFGLELIERHKNLKFKDVSLYLDSDHYNEFENLFEKDIIENKSYKIFEDPQVSMIRELHEEIGPVSSRDGINLLNKYDLEILDTPF